MRVRFSQKSVQMITDNVTQYYHMHDRQCIEQFLPRKFDYTIVDESEPADICFCGVQHEDNGLLRDDEINILLSVENLGCGRGYYASYNKFGDINNPKIDVFIYNHFSTPKLDGVADDATGDPRVLVRTFPRIMPTHMFRQRFFAREMDKFDDVTTCKFGDKKFCLFVSQNTRNENKRKCVMQLYDIGDVDCITQPEFSHLVSEPCLHGRELICLLNKYKFVVCFENSKTPGYITEKIFNVFLSKSIPIYDGAPDIAKFVNERSYVQFDDRCMRKIKLLSESQVLYDRVVGEHKLLHDPNDPILEDYLDHYVETRLGETTSSASS